MLRRIGLPILLLSIGVFLLVGCIYIPTFNATIGGKDATKSVGSAGSKKRLQPGVSTRDHVRRVLGKPFFSTSDGRFMVYSWKKQKGLFVYPLCFMATPEDNAFAMTLEFGADGVMTAFDVEQGRRQQYLFDLPHSRRFVPDRARFHQYELDLNDQPLLLEQFRATTRASTRPATMPALRYK